MKKGSKILGEEIKLDRRRDSFDEFNRLNARLRDLDDRGLVLSLAAFADDSLRELLRAFMRVGAAANQLLDGFNAPLGTFSARIKAAHALGLLTDDQFDDLENLRKIRNAFSHTWEAINFEAAQVKDRILNLSYSSIDDEYPATLADRLRTSIAAILIELRVVTNNIETGGRRLRLIGTRLIAGLGGSEEDQIVRARSDLDRLRERLSSAQGREKAFLRLLRDRWLDRLNIAVRNASPENRPQFSTLLDSLRAEIAGAERGPR
ncbi:MltR family transcriptional regulator [Sphingobium sp. RSMS]|uniref:MltR family transcriptional regulator n=1 Tax=Sphingobium sp. RSMS TaxID=520734 RepID=UPI001C118DAB|nr:MltR family transcriptional regulator [Sphingobium sp. RSMS]UXC90522.1 MltR family transcriptional regulator [Sphingobium sp. RSMS]